VHFSEVCTDYPKEGSGAILPGDSGNEILLGVPELETLGIASPKELLDQISQKGAKEVLASEFREEEALNKLFQVMKLKVCKLSSLENKESESIEQEANSEEDGTEEQGLTLNEDAGKISI
jgi:hypothetical protein